MIEFERGCAKTRLRLSFWTMGFLIGTMSLGEVAQVTAAFVIVQVALNWLVDNYTGLADCLSPTNRVASLLLAFDQLDDVPPGGRSGS